MLRKEDEELALAPQPSLAHVADLVRRAAAAGLPTELRTEGERRPLPAGVDLTAYRLVQEALTAARDGGVGRPRRGRDPLPRRRTSWSRSPTTARSTGRRLLGMRERVAVYGGELTSDRLAVRRLARGGAAAARGGGMKRRLRGVSPVALGRADRARARRRRASSR